MASIETCGQFVDPNRHGHYLFVSRSYGDTADLAKPSGTRLGTFAAAVHRVRYSRHIPTPLPPLVAGDIVSVEQHTYFGVGSTPELHGYEFYGYAVRNEPVTSERLAIKEIAVRKDLGPNNNQAILAAVLAIAMDNPLVTPETVIEINSRKPSLQGRQAMTELGLWYDRALPTAGFYATAAEVYPRLDFLGHDLMRASA